MWESQDEIEREQAEAYWAGRDAIAERFAHANHSSMTKAQNQARAMEPTEEINMMIGAAMPLPAGDPLDIRVAL